ncbi:expressed unknown protein [Seminavis robusta]|uniref:Uncharacterized protein n=1 Tax=Seminavis robusta TaxID=568900 RepID=A0A9N8F2W0_9STRA|nr:expressed unknown protein [Seminavis robusta]|eukprot:Sro3854_g351461.1  (108) ;mRNA; f:2626-2949
MTTMANSIANRVPMSSGQVQVYLQEHYGVPIVLREQGETNIKCPYCLKLYEHGLQTGHHVAGCDDCDRFNGIGIVVGERYFVPNYGYTIFLYKERAGVNELVVHEMS